MAALDAVVVGDHSGVISLTKAKNPSEWPVLRNEIELSVLSVLGTIPKKRVELQTKAMDELTFSGYVRKRINYFVSDWERISAWLFIPDQKEDLPAIVCCHRATPQGKDEPAGLDGDPTLALAQRYAERGYVTVAPDCITAGDRKSSGLEPYDTKSFYKDNPKMSAMGKMLSDHIYAVDVLCEVKCVDSARIGVVGHGLGGRNAAFLTAFDERIQACVASCGFTRFAADNDPGRWARESGFIYFPLLREAIAKKKFPFDWEHVLALMAPSPTCVITALNDDTLPATKSCDKAVRQAKQVYRLLGASDALSHFEHEDGHRMTPEILEVADDWFERWL